MSKIVSIKFATFIGGPPNTTYGENYWCNGDNKSV